MAAFPFTLLGYRRGRELTWMYRMGCLSEQPLDEWAGVATNDAGRVITLALWQNNLTGSIPREVGKLTHLGTLVLSDNALEGRTPAELGGLANLRFLGLARNGLEGNLPVAMGGMSRLYSPPASRTGRRAETRKGRLWQPSLSHCPGAPRPLVSLGAPLSF